MPIIIAITAVVGIAMLLITSMKNRGKYEEKVTRNQEDIKEMNQNITGIQGKYEEKVTRKQEDIKEIRSDIKSMDAKILEILANLQSTLLTSKSPIHLSDEGIALAKKVEAERILHTCIETLKQYVEEKVPTNPYEIQEYSKRVVYEHLLRCISEEDKNALETFAYQEGKSIETILMLFGYMLRDVILSEKDNSHE